MATRCVITIEGCSNGRCRIRIKCTCEDGFSIYGTVHDNLERPIVAVYYNDNNCIGNKSPVKASTFNEKNKYCSSINCAYDCFCDECTVFKYTNAERFRAISQCPCFECIQCYLHGECSKSYKCHFQFYPSSKIVRNNSFGKIISTNCIKCVDNYCCRDFKRYVSSRYSVNT